LVNIELLWVCTTNVGMLMPVAVLKTSKVNEIRNYTTPRLISRGGLLVLITVQVFMWVSCC